MKKALITMTTLALLGASTPRASAGNCEWATVGKVLTGVGAGFILAKALEPQPVYVAAPVYATPAPMVVQQPAPVVVQTVTTVSQPVIVQSVPVIYQPAPVVYAAPVVMRPVYAPPVVSVGFSVRGFHHHGHGRHW